MGILHTSSDDFEDESDENFFVTNCLPDGKFHFFKNNIVELGYFDIVPIQ